MQDVLGNIDQDQDGKIDYFEFCNMMMAGNACTEKDGGVLRQLSAAVEYDVSKQQIKA